MNRHSTANMFVSMLPGCYLRPLPSGFQEDAKGPETLSFRAF